MYLFLCSLIVWRNSVVAALQFKLLIELHEKYLVSLTFTRWLAAALQERKVAMRLGNWISTPQQLTVGLPQAPSPRPSPSPHPAPPPPPTHPSPVPSPLQCLHTGTGGSEQQMVLAGCLCLRTTGLSTKQPVTSAQQSMLSKSSWIRCHTGVKRQSPKSIQARRKPCVHLQQQSSRTSNASILLQWRSHRTQGQSDILWDPLQRNADVQDADQINKTQVQERISFLVGCLTSQQHSSVSHGWICSDNCTCCHTEIEVADPTFHLTQSKYTDTGPTSPSTNPITPGAWQGSTGVPIFMSLV